MISFPGCKINLGLNIIRKRDDGYHAIESVMYPVPLYDILEIVPDKEFKFVSTGLKIPGSPIHNLCVKAYELIQRDFNLAPVYIHLHKIIPLGGGLGGGSSDGAHVILLLNQLFHLELSTSDMQRYSAQLGSDCPFFIENTPQLATGRGEILSPFNISLQNYYLKIINIGIHVSTAEAYGNAVPQVPNKPVNQCIDSPISSWREVLVNDFETGIFALHPKLLELKTQLYREGALYAAMSGSGSTMFGIFEHLPSLTMEEDCPTELIVQL